MISQSTTVNNRLMMALGEKFSYRPKPVYEAMKRTGDIFCSLLALIVLSPVFLIVALWVRKEDGGPAFYAQTRAGRGGKTFKILKFRSMKQNADHLEDILTPEQIEEYHRCYWLKDDPRLTRIGEKIRKVSLDELPQLINILKGDISIVGPRPVLVEELVQYKEYKDMLLSVKPGLTGYWQTYARCNASYVNFERQSMDLYYVTHRSLWMDIQIVFHTVMSVILREGAF